jgi:short-subunit dehydrogenase
MSGVRLARHHLPRMLERGRGRIVFVASDAVVQASTDQLHYTVSKTAVLSLAEMTRGSAVTVNSVLPGPTVSAMTNGAALRAEGGILRSIR